MLVRKRGRVALNANAVARKSRRKTVRFQLTSDRLQREHT